MLSSSLSRGRVSENSCDSQWSDAKYLVEQCVKAQKDGKDEAAKELTEEYMNYYKEKGTSEAAEFAFAVLAEMGNLPAEDQKAIVGL